MFPPVTRNLRLQSAVTFLTRRPGGPLSRSHHGRAPKCSYAPLAAGGEPACLCWPGLRLGSATGEGMSLPHAPALQLRGQEQRQGGQRMARGRKTKANNPRMNVPKKKVNRLQCCNGCNKYLNKDNRRMCLLLLIHFQRLGSHSTEWLADSNWSLADHGSVPPSFLPSFLHTPSHHTSQPLPKEPHMTVRTYSPSIKGLRAK